MLRKLFRSRRSKAKLFRRIDCLFPKSARKVLFVVRDRTSFCGNLRVVLEAYAERGGDRLYAYKGEGFAPKEQEELKELMVTALSGFGPLTIWNLLTAGVVILSHNPRDAYISRKCRNRKIINLWHGVAIKRIELLMPQIPPDKLALLKTNSALYDMIIASSQEDRMTNSKAFGAPLEQVRVTGLPRYEILKSSYPASAVLREEEARIARIKGGRKLVLFAPTFREKTTSALEQLGSAEWEKMRGIAEDFGFVWGIRPHPYDIDRLPEEIAAHPNFHLFDCADFTEPNILLKHTDILIVDFTSIWVDYLLLGRPLLGFAKDYDWYLNEERGFVSDFPSTFPAVFTTSIDQLINELTDVLSNPAPKTVYQEALNRFHEYDLTENYVQRAVDAIEETRNVVRTGFVKERLSRLMD